MGLISQELSFVTYSWGAARVHGDSLSGLEDPHSRVRSRPCGAEGLAYVWSFHLPCWAPSGHPVLAHPGWAVGSAQALVSLIFLSPGLQPLPPEGSVNSSSVPLRLPLPSRRPEHSHLFTVPCPHPTHFSRRVHPYSVLHYLNLENVLGLK